ncbi:MAG TPA: hypothetical protein VD927_12745 [Chryseosolibacter sp.]|nr:hypothetical protein [Chryseosolibacter sp.]
MIIIQREELKKDWKFLIDVIQSKHVMEPVIEKELFENHKPVKGLCHQRGYFVLVGSYYLQYIMDHVITDVDYRLIGRSVMEVIFYDTYQEYEAVRIKAMSSVKDQTGINLN